MKKLKEFLNKELNKSTLFANYSFITILLLMAYAIVVFFATLCPTLYKGSLVFNVQASLDNIKSISFSAYQFDMLIYAILPIIISFLQLQFFHKKSYCYTMLSLGMKRKDILKVRLSFPIVFMVGILVVVKTIALLQNIKLFGSDPIIFQLFFAHLLTCVRIILTSYLCSLVGILLCGRRIEAIATTFSLFTLPCIVHLFVILINCTTLYGAVASTDTIITTPLKYLNHLDWSNKYFLYHYGDTTPNTLPTIIVSLIFISGCIFGFKYVQKKFHNNYKPEICGFKGTSPFAATIISTVISLTIVFYYLQLNYYYDFYGDTTEFFFDSLYLIIALIILVLGVFISNIIIHFTVKKLKYALLSLGIICLSTVVLSVINYTGIFGTFHKIPDTSEIANISVSYPFQGYVLPNCFTSAYFCEESESDIIAETEEEIEHIRNMHNAVIKNNKKDILSNLTIIYTLKNGETIERDYPYLGNEAVHELLKLYSTDVGKKYIQQYILPETIIREPDDDVNLTDTLVKCDIKKSSFWVTPKASFAHSTEEITDYDVFYNIRKAIFEDITQISYDDWYSPKAEFLGLMTLGVCVCGHESDEFGYDYYDNFYSFIPIYDTMENTIDVLNKYGYYKYLHYDTSLIDSVYIGNLKDIAEYEKSHCENDWCTSSIVFNDLQNPIFIYDSFHYDIEENPDYPVKKVTDKKEIEFLLKKAKGHCYIDENKDYKVIFIQYKNDDINDQNCYIIPS